MSHCTLFKRLFLFVSLLLPLLALTQVFEPYNDRPNPSIVLDQEPVPINLEEIRRLIGYPTEAIKLDIQGKVVLQILIDLTGSYLKHKVIENPNPILTDAVASKIVSLRFNPAILHGEPTKVWVTIPFEFKLRGSENVPQENLDTLEAKYYPSPDDFVLIEKPAIPINLTEFKAQLGYPEEAKLNKISGKVVLKILVNERGNYVRHLVLKNPHRALTALVEANIRYLRYAPAIKDGMPIPYWITLPFDFVMIE